MLRRLGELSGAWDVVVIGGGIARSANLFLPDAVRALDGLKVELRVTKLGDNAPLVGAGAAWFSQSGVPAVAASANVPAREGETFTALIK